MPAYWNGTERPRARPFWRDALAAAIGLLGLTLAGLTWASGDGLIAALMACVTIGACTLALDDWWPA